MRSTSISTPEEAEVILPNSTLITGKVINWSRLGRRRPVEIPVKVAYGTNPHDVIELLVKTAASNPEVLVDPPPSAFMLGFGETALEFSLVFWVGRYHVHKKIRSDVAIKVTEEFVNAGIRVPVTEQEPSLSSSGKYHQAKR
jgi:small-conductance mechanosensitive channel